MKYSVILSKEAVKTLDRLDRKLASRIKDTIKDLERSPKQKGKALKSINDLFSVRVGDWRILYQVSVDRRQVYIIAIRPRGQAYQRL